MSSRIGFNNEKHINFLTNININSMKYNLDEKNRHILQILQENNKLTVKEIAAQINLSFTPTYERIKDMEEKGIIRKYVALLDRRKIGLRVAAYCNVTLKAQNEESLITFEDAVKGVPNIVEVVSLSGTYDYMLKIIAKDIDSYNKFMMDVVSNLPGMGQYHSSIVLSEVKLETGYEVPDPKEVD